MTKRSLFDSLRDFFAADEPPPVEPPPSAQTVSVPPSNGGPLPPPDEDERWQSRIPGSSYQRVLTIRERVKELEKETRTRGMATELDELGRIKEGHLPRLIQSYIEIPAEHRAEVFRETGRSASFLLNESLDKILARLKDISSQLARGNITTFSENIRFVDLYYDQNKDPFG